MMNKKGFGLIIGIFIIVFLASLGIIGAAMLSTDVEIALDTLHSTRAFYIAEAGLQDVFYKLVNDSSFRNSPTSPVTGSIANGTFSVTVSKSGDDYTLTSTGRVASVVTRKIVQVVTIASGNINAAIHGDGAHVRFSGSTGGTVNGNVTCFTSVLNEEDLANYQDFVDGTYTITEGVEHNPSLFLATYLALAQADGAGHTGTNLTLSSGTYDGVYYATNDIAIQDGVVINGSVVAERHVKFDNGPITVTIKPEESTRAQTDGQNYVAIYAGRNITSTDTGSPAGRRGLANGTINGLVLAGNNIMFNYMDNTTFSGCLIADNNLDFLDTNSGYGLDFTITYNANIFSPMVVGFVTAGAATITSNSWEETN